MKKNLLAFLAAILVLSLTACTSTTTDTANTAAFYTFTDDMENTVILDKKPQNVVALMGSYGEIWLEAGGALKGVTEDALSERGLSLTEDTKVIGTVKEPNIELVLQLEPDFVLLSADIESHVKLKDTLAQSKIPHAYFKVDKYSEYLSMLKTCTDITENSKVYEDTEKAMKEEIEASLAQSGGEKGSKILLIRSMSTKAKALKNDHMVGIMLEDFGLDNIATRHESLLEDLSMETIIEEDPEYIFVITMGDVDKAMKSLEGSLMSNPAWNTLSAVKNDNFHVLPKNLFQYKPCGKWAESYDYLADILTDEKK